jgi:hypothetical protein
MTKIPPKKGPHRMATAYKPENAEQVGDQELNATIMEFAKKAHRVIQKARRKMTPTERAEADRNANEILDASSASAKRARKRA